MSERKQQIESILNEKGFSEYKWIDPKSIVVSQWVRVKCTFGCSDYGLGTCPPNTPSVEDCKNFFSEYSNALIIRFTKFADKTAYPSVWSKEMTGKLLEAEREIFLKNYPKAFLLNQTCCDVCNDCQGTRANCKDKRRARPSPEGFAVDVYQTSLNAGFNLHVIAENPAEISRIAIIMLD
jgi:predicted metal-binding protein